MESSRRWWIRPVLGMLLGVVVAALFVSAARGRAPVAPIEPAAMPGAHRTAGPAQVELVDEPTPLVPTPSAEPASRPTAATTPRAAATHAATATPTSRPTRTPNPRPAPTPAPAPTRALAPRPTRTVTPTPTCVPVKHPSTGKLGWLGNLRDERIDESSGLTMSRRHADLAYTMNDEGSSPMIFGIQPSTGRTVSAFDLPRSGDFEDPEAIRLDPKGRIWLADTGDGHPGKPGRKHERASRDHVTIAVFDEPERGERGTVSARRHRVVFSNGPHNAEALAIHPQSGQAFLISSDRVGRVYRLPNPLHGGRNVAQATNHLMPAFVTDATFTGDGRFVLVRTMQKPDILVLDAMSWRRVGSIDAPRMEKGESVTVEPNGQTVLLGSEGQNSPVVRVALPRFAQSSAPLKSRC